MWEAVCKSSTEERTNLIPKRWCFLLWIITCIGWARALAAARCCRVHTRPTWCTESMGSQADSPSCSCVTQIGLPDRISSTPRFLSPESRPTIPYISTVLKSHPLPCTIADFPCVPPPGLSLSPISRSLAAIPYPNPSFPSGFLLSSTLSLPSVSLTPSSASPFPVQDLQVVAAHPEGPAVQKEKKLWGPAPISWVEELK
jgi:hypothetical protein